MAAHFALRDSRPCTLLQSYDIQDRLVSVYLDFNELRVDDADQILVEQSFFLDTGATLSGKAP